MAARLAADFSMHTSTHDLCLLLTHPRSTVVQLARVLLFEPGYG